MIPTFECLPDEIKEKAERAEILIAKHRGLVNMRERFLDSFRSEQKANSTSLYLYQSDSVVGFSNISDLSRSQGVNRIFFMHFSPTEEEQIILMSGFNLLISQIEAELIDLYK